VKMNWPNVGIDFECDQEDVVPIMEQMVRIMISCCLVVFEHLNFRYYFFWLLENKENLVTLLYLRPRLS